jgi:hypothetical protein
MPVRAATTQALLAVLCLAGGGCGPAMVEGSLSALLDLHYERVWVDTSSEEVGVRFGMPHGAGEDTVLRVTAKLDGAELFANIKFDLAEKISTGAQRGTVSRDVQGDSTKSFPPILVGTFHLRDLPGESGTSVRGDFNVRFEDCIQFACGYTAYATFTGKVP